MSDVVPFAVLSSDGQSFRLSAGAWSGTYRIGQIDDQMAFYRRMRDRKATPGKAGPYSRFYEQTVAALERLEKQVRK
jgi:hypothetical protein